MDSHCVLSLHLLQMVWIYKWFFFFFSLVHCCLFPTHARPSAQKDTTKQWIDKHFFVERRNRFFLKIFATLLSAIHSGHQGKEEGKEAPWCLEEGCREDYQDHLWYGRQWCNACSGVFMDYVGCMAYVGCSGRFMAYVRCNGRSIAYAGCRRGRGGPSKDLGRFQWYGSNFSSTAFSIASNASTKMIARTIILKASHASCGSSWNKSKEFPEAWLCTTFQTGLNLIGWNSFICPILSSLLLQVILIMLDYTKLGTCSLDLFLNIVEFWSYNKYLPTFFCILN